jgi:outer membrane protein TolC
VKRTALLFLLGCLPLAAAAPSVTPRAEADGRLSLAAALDRAVAVNPTVLLSHETLQQSVATSQTARAPLLPQITFDATQRRTRSASVGENVVRSGISNRFDSVLNGRLDVLDPQRIANYKATTLAVGAAELDTAQVRETMMTTVAQAYFTHLRNRSRTDVLDSNVARARALLELARRQAEAGVATQIDVTRAEAQLATVDQARLQQETVVRTSELQLQQLLALDVNTPLELAPFRVRAAAAPEISPALEEAARERRADLRRAERLLEQYDMEVRAARLDRLPSMALVGSYGTATENVLDGREARIWAGSVALSLPVFDGQRIRSLQNLAMSRRRAQEVRVRELALRVAAELRLAAQDAASRLAQIAVAQKNERLAQDELRLARLRYEQGVADNREVVDAQNRLAQASDNLVEAVYLYNLSRVELARSRGDVRAILAEQAE